MHARHRSIALTLPAALLASTWGSCGPSAGHSHSHDHEQAAAAEPEWPALPLTIWTERYEYFLEYEVPAPGRPSGFVIHVTRLSDGAPRTEGPLSMVFRSGAEALEVPLPQPARTGIYLTEVTFPSTGTWQWELAVDGDRPEMPEVRVVADEQEAWRLIGAEDEPAGAITMLKEQQWPVRLRVERVRTQRLQESMPTTARIEAPPQGAAWMPAPASGILLAPVDGALPELGQSVEEGQLLARLRVPYLGGDLAAWESASLQRDAARVDAELGRSQAAASVDSARAEVERARRELERVTELHRREAKSDRELEEARAALASAEASERAAEDALRAWSEALARLFRPREGVVSPADTSLDIELRAPVAGRVVEAAWADGAWVEDGQSIFRILNGERLWVVLRVPESALAALGPEPSARLRHPTGGGWLALPGEGGRVLASAPRVDPQTRSAAVVFEIRNPGWLRPGMTAEVALDLGEVRDAIALPVDAVVDQDGVSAVYVHTAGETFEQRMVRTGVRDGDRIEIVEGLREGEQVVVAGAYVVRLVSLSGAIPEHAH